MLNKKPEICKRPLTFRRRAAIIILVQGDETSPEPHPETYPGVCVSQCFYPQIHKRIPCRYADAKPPFAVEGSKQPQVSALPERRVKKLRQTAFTGYLRSSHELRFFCSQPLARQYKALSRRVGRGLFFHILYSSQSKITPIKGCFSAAAASGKLDLPPASLRFPSLHQRKIISLLDNILD